LKTHCAKRNSNDVVLLMVFVRSLSTLSSSTPNFVASIPRETLVKAMKYGRVILADRHLGLLGGVHGLLDALFETVLMVADERSLVDALTSFKPDLVIVDLSLPGKGEVNIAKRLLGNHPDMRLIVLSVHDELTVVGQMLELGVAGYVLKRNAATDLIPAVKEVLRGGTYVCSALRDCR
jgi:DNA-binding NarL/FixJ family response regulator